MDKPTNTPGILTLDATSNVQNFNIALDIPKQVMTLRSVRVQMSSQANALAARILYVDLPFLSGNQVLDGNVGQVYLPIFLDNAEVTFAYGKEMAIYMNDYLPSKFTMRCLGTDFKPIANLVSCSLTFSLEKGHL